MVTLWLWTACAGSKDGAPVETGESGGESGGEDSPIVESDPGETNETGTGETGDTDQYPDEIALEFVGEKPTNLLILSLDTLRRDQVGYFSGLDTTPNLDALMAESVVLEDHRSCSTWTAPSFLCSLIGYEPWDQGWLPTTTGYSDDGSADPDVPWTPDDIETVAQALSDAGYATTLLTSNQVFSDRPGGGMANGFQTIRLPLWYPAGDVGPKVLTNVSELMATGQPWYFHGHFIDPHAPYVAPVEYATDADELGPFEWDLESRTAYETIEDEWDSMTDAEQAQAYNYLLTIYRAELRYWDANFATTWAELDAAGALDDTLVVFYSDHGEQFAEHGHFHHGVSTQEEENRATMFFWAKNLQARQWNHPTVHTDLAPTLYDVFDLPPSSAHTGFKLGDAPDDRAMFQFTYIYGWGSAKISVVKDGVKLMYGFDGFKRLYDVEADPFEEENLYSPTDARVLELWDLLLPKVEAIEAQWPSVTATNAGP